MLANPRRRQRNSRDADSSHRAREHATRGRETALGSFRFSVAVPCFPIGAWHVPTGAVHYTARARHRVSPLARRNRGLWSGLANGGRRNAPRRCVGGMAPAVPGTCQPVPGTGWHVPGTDFEEGGQTEQGERHRPRLRPRASRPPPARHPRSLAPAYGVDASARPGARRPDPSRFVSASPRSARARSTWRISSAITSGCSADTSVDSAGSRSRS